MVNRYSCATTLLLSLVSGSAFAANIQVDPSAGQSDISPYVYGTNQVGSSTVRYTALRAGGNRLTGYNWENNFSNAGTDWQNSSDTYLCDTPSVCTAPGTTLSQFVESCRQTDAYALVTLQMAGYVSADDDGTVTNAQAAPSARWKKVVAKKGSAFTTTPDITDASVYMDEVVNFLVQRYGKANAGGVQGYSLDNEPDLWSGTHPLIHSQAVGAVELVDKSVELASAIKAVDSSADVFGFISYGYAGFVNLQEAADWASVKGNYEWYVQYFLAEMAKASADAGVRLLDVLDLHYYSEAQGGGARVQEGTTANAAARVQSTRSLWDANYGYSATDPTAGENSWITQWNDPIELIPRVKRYIRDLYPGTKFAMTEYDFGAASHVSGGLAQADALGVFGKEGVYFASRWGEPAAYIDAAFRLFLDYDGNGGHFGDVSVSATTNDTVNVPVYASVDKSDPKILHLVLINRNLTTEQVASVTIGGSSTYSSGNAWGFDGSNASITSRGAIAVANNSFSVTLPAMSAFHVTLSTDNPPLIIGGGDDGVGGTGNGGTSGANGSSPTGTNAGNTSVGGANGTGTIGTGDDTSTENADDGCGCRVSSSSGTAFGSLTAVFGLALALLRRRRSR